MLELFFELGGESRVVDVSLSLGLGLELALKPLMLSLNVRALRFQRNRLKLEP
jgi:hypothetical protein